MNILYSILSGIKSSMVLQVQDRPNFLPHPVNLSTDASKTMLPHYAMENGKMVSRTHGDETAMAEDVILEDGTTVSPNGMIQRSDGEVRQLSDGEAITLAGRIQSHQSVMNPDIPTGEFGEVNFLCSSAPFVLGHHVANHRFPRL